jgi:hypothetical protein
MRGLRRFDSSSTSPIPDFQADRGNELTKLTKPQFCQFSQFVSGEQPEISQFDSCLGASEVDTARVSRAEWKLAVDNRLFQEQGVTEQPGRSTATTVRRSMRLPNPKVAGSKERR